MGAATPIGNDDVNQDDEVPGDIQQLALSTSPRRPE